MVTPNVGGYSQVLVILKRDGQQDVDLSQAWSTIEYEHGIPQHVKIILNSRAGRFMTTPHVIAKFDTITVSITDARDNVIEDVFHIRKLKRGSKRGKNKQLVLICRHQSASLWKQTISVVARRTSGADALDRIAAILNRSQDK